ncbi:aldehyde dehydrogenase family protein [Vallitalea longa]|uniref:aldehyde dehydrogenase family protein n=1 Tax=Vallitalea longa TaxID=2936439 RepID=UPI002ED3D061
MYKQYINGSCIEGDGSIIKVVNPATEEIVTEFKGASSVQTETALTAAYKAFKTWSKLSINERNTWIEKLRIKLLEEKNNMVNILISETGKTTEDAEYDFGMLILCLSYYQEEAKRVYGETIPDYDDNFKNIIVKKPRGVIAAHLAWNFPLLNVGYKLGPSLASGCTCILKPSKETPLTTLYIGKVAESIDFPEGVINIISGLSSEVAATINGSKIPSLITLIGSTETGLKIVEQSSTSIKHFSLELGGNAPAVVTEHAKIEDAAKKLVDLKFTNAGQVCVSPNRIFVHSSVYDTFIKYAKEFAEKVVLGAGSDEGAMMGPLLTDRARTRMLGLIEDAVNHGAKVITGGKKPEDHDKGYYLLPTILTDVDKDMKVYREEIFGPIMGIAKFDTIEEVIEKANDTEYGLTSYVFSENLSEVMKLSEAIDAGTVCVNEPYYAINQPHGGVKQSGIGKDCSKYSLEEYFTLKRISLRV